MRECLLCDSLFLLTVMNISWCSLERELEERQKKDQCFEEFAVKKDTGYNRRWRKVFICEDRRHRSMFANWWQWAKRDELTDDVAEERVPDLSLSEYVA